MIHWIRREWGRRPLWLNVLLLFCLYMALVYVPWDLLLKPLAQDEEVWFGIRFHGAWAKLLALPHWAVYALGAFGLWGMRSWMWPWAAVYVGQVALGFFIWPLVYVGGLRGLVSGLIGAALFGTLARALWRARQRFQPESWDLLGRYGGFALVTGASAGIGAAFARALAREGLSCVLVARRQERLAQLALEIEKAHGVETRVVVADLATREGVARVLEATDGIDIGVVVNNAGVGYAGPFEGQDAGRLDMLVQLNCAAPVALSAGLLPRLRSRGRGALIFTGSVAGCQPLPLHALYAATKAFDNLLAEALWAELLETGIDVLVLEPGSTETEFQEVAGELPHPGQSAEAVVETALAALGHRPSVIAGGLNWLRSNAAFRLLPRSVLALAAKSVTERSRAPRSL